MNRTMLVTIFVLLVAMARASDSTDSRGEILDSAILQGINGQGICQKKGDGGACVTATPVTCADRTVAGAAACPTVTGGDPQFNEKTNVKNHETCESGGTADQTCDFDQMIACCKQIKKKCVPDQSHDYKCLTADDGMAKDCPATDQAQKVKTTGGEEEDES